MGGSTSGGRTIHSKNAGKGSFNSRLEDFKTKNEKPKVFTSFSMRNLSQLELLRYQNKNLEYNLNFEDNSLMCPVKDRNWKGPVGTKILESDAVICLIGQDTHSRPAVSWELKLAYKNNIPVIPVRIHKSSKYHRPEIIRKNEDQTIPWDLNKIQYQLKIALGED
jgi:hypothetical protein